MSLVNFKAYTLVRIWRHRADWGSAPGTRCTRSWWGGSTAPCPRSSSPPRSQSRSWSGTQARMSPRSRWPGAVCSSALDTRGPGRHIPGPGPPPAPQPRPLRSPAESREMLVWENMSLLSTTSVTCIRVPTDMVLMSLMLRTGCSRVPSVTTYLYLIWCFNAQTTLLSIKQFVLCCIIMIMMVLWCSLQYVAPIASMLTATVGPCLPCPCPVVVLE